MFFHLESISSFDDRSESTSMGYFSSGISQGFVNHGALPRSAVVPAGLETFASKSGPRDGMHG